MRDGLLRTVFRDILRGNLARLEQSRHDIERLLVLLVAEQVTRLKNLVHDTLVFVVQEDGGADVADLGLEQAKGVGVRDISAHTDVGGQLFVRLAQLFLTVGIGAVLAKVAIAFSLEVFANLSFVVVVRNIEHFVLDFDWKLLSKTQNRSSRKRKNCNTLKMRKFEIKGPQVWCGPGPMQPLECAVCWGAGISRARPGVQ